MTPTSGTRRVFELAGEGTERIPAVLLKPRSETPVPAVLLLHGLSSNKERMVESIGRSLLRRGIASLAVDLPSHGTRDRGIESLSRQTPLSVVRLWRLALREADLAFDFLEREPGIDPKCLAIAGYSLGSFVALFVAADNPRVRAVALAAGGDLPPNMPMESLVRTLADPRRAVRRIAGRPLFMLNGQSDRTTKPEQARALFQTAREPKTLQWYAGGHWPPVAAIDAVAEWLQATLHAKESTRERRTSGTS